MDDFTRQLQGARDLVQLDWDERRAQASLPGLLVKRRRRQVRRQVAATTAALALVVGTSVVIVNALDRGEPAHPAPPELAVKPADVHRTLPIEGGITARTLTADTELEVVESTPKSVATRLRRGRSHFDVTPNRERAFSVLSADVVITVVGTEFTVDNRGRSTRVVVHRGHVRVTANGESHDLRRGDAAAFAHAEAEAAAETPAEEVSKEAPTTTAKQPRRAKKRKWQDLAREGNYKDAFEELEDVRDEPNELLLAADVARLSGHPRQAVPHLERVRTKYRRDSRAPLAAFTLGRIYFESLGRPAEAARTFRDARTLAPRGPLAEDALAREVQAWAKAGNKAKARAAARQYLSLYPNGRRAASVKRFADL